jgi:hypothetical protein
VLALACDRIVERGDGWDFADLLVDELIARAIVDDAGVRRSNHEHRATPPELKPQSGWAMGSAGITRESFAMRDFARVAPVATQSSGPTIPVSTALGGYRNRLVPAMPIDGPVDCPGSPLATTPTVGYR